MFWKFQQNKGFKKRLEKLPKGRTRVPTVHRKSSKEEGHNLSNNFTNK